MTIYHYIVLGMFVTFAIADHIGRRTRFPEITFWRVMGVISFVLYFTIATFAPFLWDEWLGARQLIDGSVLPLWAQIVAGFLILEFGIDFWHRTMHSVDTLWRLTHQMHHSAERVDIWGAYYFHPLDMLGWAFLGSFCLVWIFGLSPEAGLVVNLLATLPPMLQHANIRTPYWLSFSSSGPKAT